MSSVGVSLLYTGIALLILSTIFCIFFNYSKYLCIFLWAITIGFIIAGIIVDSVQDESYCGYTRIFDVPMNYVRDPNNIMSRYNLPGFNFNRDKYDQNQEVPVENIV